MAQPLVSSQVVRVVRRELALLGQDPARVGQLLEVADLLLERAAIDDELARRRDDTAPSDPDRRIRDELGVTDTAGHSDVGEDPTTSFESAQPPTFDADTLVTAFEHNAPELGVREVRELRRISGGFSKETVRAMVVGANRTATDVVIRKVAAGRRADGLRPEYDALTFVAASSTVPIPRPLWYDAEALGTPAFAATGLPGRPVGNVWGWTEAPSRQVVRDLGRALGSLHALDPAGLESSAPLPPLTTRADHLAAIAERADVLHGIWEKGGQAFRPVFEQVLSWLRAHAPSDGAAEVLVHGDYGLHNALVADGRLAGMLDWERAHLGNPAEDLAYVKPIVDQADTWADFVADYRQAGGPAMVDADLAYFTVWQDLWRAVSSYRVRAKFLDDPVQLSDAIAGLLMSPRFLARAAYNVMRNSQDGQGKTSC